MKYTVSTSIPPQTFPPRTTGSPTFSEGHKKFAVNVEPDLERTMAVGHEFFRKVKTDPVFAALAERPPPAVCLAPTTIVSPNIEISDPNRAYEMPENG
jgi:hypothetical protein